MKYAAGFPCCCAFSRCVAPASSTPSTCGRGRTMGPGCGTSWSARRGCRRLRSSSRPASDRGRWPAITPGWNSSVTAFRHRPSRRHLELPCILGHRRIATHGHDVRSWKCPSSSTRRNRLRRRIRPALRGVFAASPAYRTTVQFILEAMATVWTRHPARRLAITGFDPDEEKGHWLRDLHAAGGRDARVEILGQLPRAELLDLYQDASVLLAPLFEDTRSIARFPTKIGEYLAAGRPVLTNAVGEVPEVLRRRRERSDRRARRRRGLR